jgi:hypothetical protein
VLEVALELWLALNVLLLLLLLLLFSIVHRRLH